MMGSSFVRGGLLFDETIWCFFTLEVCLSGWSEFKIGMMNFGHYSAVEKIIVDTEKLDWSLDLTLFQIIDIGT